MYIIMLFFYYQSANFGDNCGAISHYLIYDVKNAQLTRCNLPISSSSSTIILS